MQLDFHIGRAHSPRVRSPVQPTSLSVEQIAELNQKLCTMRHDINNYLALIMAATELMRYKPEALERMLPTLREQPAKIGEALAKFSSGFETALGIKDC